MDPGTGLTVLGTAVGSAKLIEKILGPTAEYLGTGLRDWTERSLKNVGRVFENAKEKLGDRIDQPGAVPPKVLKGVLDDAAFSEDEVAVEYFGGVLASSRTEVGRDDRGAALTALIGRLTTYQLRSHYFFYTVLKSLYEGVVVNIGVPEGRRQLQTFVPFPAYFAALEFGRTENVSSILSHVMFGLAREALIEELFRFGDADGLRPYYQTADRPGLLFSPSALGVELFLWANGRGDLTMQDFLKPDFRFRCAITLHSTAGITSTAFPERSLDA